jgi:hypothetical protein
MGDAGRQMPDGFHFPGLSQLRFQALALGDHGLYPRISVSPTIVALMATAGPVETHPPTGPSSPAGVAVCLTFLRRFEEKP